MSVIHSLSSELHLQPFFLGTQNFFKQFNDNKSGFTDDVGSSLSATPNLFEKFKESKSLSNNGSAQDKGSPSINRKDSIAANQKKMRTLKKFGMFAFDTSEKAQRRACANCLVY